MKKQKILSIKYEFGWLNIDMCTQNFNMKKHVKCDSNFNPNMHWLFTGSESLC